MRSKIFIVLAVVVSLYSGIALAAGEEKWPTKPIEIIVPYPPGGPSDMGARVYAPLMSKELGVPVVILNKPSPGGTGGAEYIAKAKPDGYQLIEVRFTTFSERPYMFHVNYTIDDFTYIMSHTDVASALLVKKDAPWNDFRSFIEYARKSPRGVTLGVTAPYDGTHISMDWISRREGVKISIVPFTGSGAMVPALLGGHIDCGASLGGHSALIQGGKLKTLLQFSGRSADATKVPRITEIYPELPKELRMALGIPKGLSGPKGMPAPVVQKLANALRNATKTEEFKRYAEQENYEIVTWDGAQIYEAIEIEHKAYGDLLKKMGFVKK